MDTLLNTNEGSMPEQEPQEMPVQLRDATVELQQETHKRNSIHKNALYAGRQWRNTMDRVDPHRKTGFLE